MGAGEYVDDWGFVDELSEYLKEGSGEAWNRLVEKYPFQAVGEGRYVFLPSESEMVDEEGLTDFLVGKPEAEEVDIDEEDLYSDLSRYLLAESIPEKLDTLSELEDRYEHSYVSDTEIMFGPNPDTGVSVSVPHLTEIVEAYDGESVSGEEADLMIELASETADKLGLMDRTVFVEDGEIFVAEHSSEPPEFYRVEHMGEAISINEAVGTYETVREASFEEACETFDSINQVFEAGEFDGARLLIDPVNEQAMIYDQDTIDMSVMDLDEVDELLSGEGLVERIEDFYSNLKS
ncbi:MAG: hypothetical protein ACLFTA_00530 [Candidatus Nanohaloarchaea archaeon]